MPHLDEKALADTAAGGLPNDPEARAHLDECSECRARLAEVNAFGRAKTVVAEATTDLGVAQGPPTANEKGQAKGGAALGRGEALGRYLLLERLGAGGMGEVFAAYDPQLDRKVALKLLRPGVVAKEEGRARLLREAQAMARLQHPNVIAVHDVGTFEDRVFVAMEFVEGETLGQWLRANRSWHEVLEMFLDAGRGLAAAHSAGLIHRDFKPDNVLVDREGRPRVLDFGLARQAAAKETPTPANPLDLEQATPRGALDSPLTQAGRIMGTPGYMAPEQLHGKATDARTDQFSFCVALFEALFGQLPFSGPTLGAVAQAIAAQRLPDPPRDSEVPRWVLDVLRRGLAASPEDRFPSMDPLLAALKRERARGRKRLIAGAAAAMLVGLGGVAYGLASRARVAICRGAPERLAGVWDDGKRAEVRAAFLATGKPFAEDTLRGVERALDEYTRAWVALSVDTCEAARVRGTDSDEVFALKTLCLEGRLKEVSALVKLLASADGEVVSNAVSAARALDDVRACADALALTRRPAKDPASREREEQARGRLIEGKALHDAGKYALGLEVANRALEEARRLGDRALEAEAFLLLGKLQDRAGDAKAAKDSLFEAAVAAEASGSDELAVRAWSLLVSVEGYVLAQREQARQWARLAEAALERLGPSDEVEADLHANFGNLALAEARFDEAHRRFELALGLRERVLGPEHPEVAMMHNNLGVALARLGKLDVAVKHHERSMELHRRTVGPEHPNVANAMNNAGVIYARLGNYSAALERYQQAMAIRERTLGAVHPEVANSLQALGNLHARLGDDTRALELHRRALGIREQLYGSDHPSVAESHSSIANALLTMREWQRALEHAQRAFTLYAERLGAMHPSTSSAQEMIGQAWAGLRQFDRAQVELERALEARRRSLGGEHPNVARSYKNIGDLLLAQGRADRALTHYQKALALREKALGPDNSTVAYDLVGIGRSYQALGNAPLAVSYFERALAIREKSDDALELALVRFELAKALWTARDRPRSLALAQQARETYAGLGERGRAELSKVEEWLASHPAP